MIPVTPVIPGCDLPVTKIAENQSEYQTLPAYYGDDGFVMTRWRMTLKERLRAFIYGDIYLIVWTFKAPLQPVCLQVEPPKVLQEYQSGK
jgi:hypothetical protein